MNITINHINKIAHHQHYKFTKIINQHQHLSYYSSKPSSSILDFSKKHLSKDEYNNLQDTFKKEYVLKKKPVLLRGLAKDWNAVSAWNNNDTQQYVKNQYGNRKVQIQFSQNSKYDALNASGEMEYSAVSTMTVNDFWNEYVEKNVDRGDYAYITEGSSSITKKAERINENKDESSSTITYRDILNDASFNTNSTDKNQTHTIFQQPFFDDPNFNADKHMTKSLLWIAAGNAIAAPHRDLYHNFNVTISGKKVFYLIPPCKFKEVYDFPRMSYRLQRLDEEGLRYSKNMITSDEGDPLLTRGFSSLNFKELYENKEDPMPLKFTCLPGDVIYLPYNYYHHVYSTCDDENKSIAINFWQTSLFGIDIETDKDPFNGSQLEKEIVKNAVIVENLKMIEEYENRAYD